MINKFFKIFLISGVLSLIIFWGNFCFAQIESPIAAETLEETIDALINFFFFLSFALAPLMIIYAAFLIMTAGGNATQINKGRTIILWTLAAIAIILLAKGLPAIIKGALGG